MVQKEPHMIRYVISVLGLFVFALGGWAQSSTPGQTSPPKKVKELPSKHSGLPAMGEFQMNQTESPQAREHRQIREKQYGHILPHPVSDPGTLVNGQQEDVDLTFIDHVYVQKPGTEGIAPEPRGIPVSASNAIVIGTILSGKSFINSDHDYVYSDYLVRVDQVLKQDAATNLSMGEQLVATRAGGVIHFPSGHIIHFFIQGHGLPKIGSQYVLFLVNTVPGFPEYRIAFPSSYELDKGRVYPLDDPNSEYDGMAASAFLGVVSEAIAASTKGVKP
jgi:hypothetical protein